MLGGIVRSAVLPGSPEDTHPGASENTDGVGLLAAALTGSAVDFAGPSRCVSGVVGKAGDGGSQVFVAGPAEDNAAVFAEAWVTGQTPTSAAS